MARPRTRPPGKFAEQGAQFTALIQQHVLTVGALAELTDISTQMLFKLKAGETLPSTQTKAALSRVLGETSIEAIGWPRAKSPLSKAALSKATPPGSLGAALKTWRLALPGPPDQFEMAARLGIKERAYQYLETGGGKRMKRELLEKLLAIHGDKLLDLIKDPLKTNRAENMNE